LNSPYFLDYFTHSKLLAIAGHIDTSLVLNSLFRICQEHPLPIGHMSGEFCQFSPEIVGAQLHEHDPPYFVLPAPLHLSNLNVTRGGPCLPRHFLDCLEYFDLRFLVEATRLCQEMRGNLDLDVLQNVSLGYLVALMVRAKGEVMNSVVWQERTVPLLLGSC